MITLECFTEEKTYSLKDILEMSDRNYDSIAFEDSDGCPFITIQDGNRWKAVMVCDSYLKTFKPVEPLAIKNISLKITF